MRVHLLEVFYFDGGKFPQPEKLIHSLPFFGLTSPPCGQKRTIVCDSLIKKKRKKKNRRRKYNGGVNRENEQVLYYVKVINVVILKKYIKKRKICINRNYRFLLQLERGFYFITLSGKTLPIHKYPMHFMTPMIFSF